MGKFTAIQTYDRFTKLKNANKINERSLNFILDTGQLYTHGIFLNNVAWGTETTGAVELTIAGVKKTLSLSNHTHSNYLEKNANIDLGTYKIVSGNVDLLYYSSGNTYLGNTSSPLILQGSSGSIKKGDTTYTILDTLNFTILAVSSAGHSLQNAAKITYGSSNFLIDYIKRLNTTLAFNDLNAYSNAGITLTDSKYYAFITLRNDGSDTASWAQVRFDIASKTMQYRTSAASTTWYNVITSIPYNALNVAGIVSAPTSNDANKVWKTDASGNPGWKDDSNSLYYLTLNGTVYGSANTTNLGTFYAIPTSDASAANQVWMRNSDNNGYAWRTLGDRAFDSTAYLPLTGGTLTGGLTAQNGIIITGSPTAQNGDFVIKNSVNSTQMAFGYSMSEYLMGFMQFREVTKGVASSNNSIRFHIYGHDNLLNILGSGNIGIGTTSPAYKLEVNGQTLIEGRTHIVASGIGFNRNVTTGGIFDSNYNGGQINYSNSHDGIEFGLLTSSSSSYNIGMFLHNSGNLGIGTTSPSYRLDVNGSANATTLYENGTTLSNKYLALTGGTMTGTIYGNTGNGLTIQSNNTGSWKEGIRVYPASNNYTLISLQDTSSSNVFAMVFNTSSQTAYFDYYKGSTGKVILMPYKDGTIALTSDISDYTYSKTESDTKYKLKTSIWLPETKVINLNFKTYLDTSTTNLHNLANEELSLFRFFAQGNESNYSAVYEYPVVDSHAMVFSIDGNKNYLRLLNFDLRSNDIYTITRNVSTWRSWVRLLSSENYTSYVYSKTDSDSRYVNISGDTMTGSLQFNTTSTNHIQFQASDYYAGATNEHMSIGYGRIQSWGQLYINANTDNSGTEYIIMTAGHGVSNSTADGLAVGTNTLTWKDNTIWHAGNDGSGSGLDADLLDGLHSSYFATSGHTHTYIESLGDVAPETGRTGERGGVYAYRPYGNRGDNAPSNYGAVIGFGWGYRGSAEIWADWCGAGIWYRTLRDCCENWYGWRRIYDAAYHPSADYANSAGSAPASDVYAWAKASTKPSYSFSEITSGAADIGDGYYYMRFRTNSSWESGIYYHTTGNEALVFANAKSITSWIFANTSPSGRADWTTLSPSLQIKDKSVYINSLIGGGVTPSYNLYVNGSANATTLYENGTSLSSKYLTLTGGTLTGALCVKSNIEIQMSSNPYLLFHMPNVNWARIEFDGSFHFRNGPTGGGYHSLTAYGFVKNGSSSSYVLTGDGGHAAISGLSVSYASSSGTTRGIGISANSGDILICDGGAAWVTVPHTAISDIRKKDVLNYNAEPTFEAVANAPAIRFTYKDARYSFNQGVKVGSIAQYWKTELPETVNEDKEGYLSMQYDVIALLSTIAVAKRVTNHEERINILENENKMLKEKIIALEQTYKEIEQLD